jgi:hypothetical protein
MPALKTWVGGLIIIWPVKSWKIILKGPLSYPKQDIQIIALYCWSWSFRSRRMLVFIMHERSIFRSCIFDKRTHTLVFARNEAISDRKVTYIARILQVRLCEARSNPQLAKFLREIQQARLCEVRSNPQQHTSRESYMLVFARYEAIPDRQMFKQV